MKKLHQYRKNYTKFQLNEVDLEQEPFSQFKGWFEEALKDGSFEANAMVLSTVNAERKPSSRVVLLKQIVEEGFIFYTNFKSKKGLEIEQNSNGAILFFWENLQRQVRIEGNLEKIPENMAIEYFNSRPIDSQIGAIVSNQSEVLANRTIIEKQFDLLKQGNKILSKPKHWGGYILKPNYFEFWQGRPNRLHDRIVYQKQSDKWDIKRLNP